MLLHCFGPVKTRRDKLVKRSPGKVPGGLVPCVARITVNGLRYLNMFKSSCSARSKANMHSCVRMISLTIKRIHTMRGLGRGTKISMCGLKAKGKCSMLSVIGTFSGTYKGRVPCRVGPHHTKSVTAYCYSTSGTGRRLR